MFNTEDLTPEQSSFMEGVFSASDGKYKFFTKALAISNAVSIALDEMLDTPLRDLQVFDPKIFGDIAGLSLHSILTPITIAFTLVGALPFIAKVFNKNTISNLSDVINNIQDFDSEFEISDEDLKDKFDFFLKKKGYGHLKVEIKTKEKRSWFLRPFLGKLEKKSVQFKYREGDGLKKILFSDWENNKNKTILSIIDELIIKLGGTDTFGLPKLDADPKGFLEACKQIYKQKVIDNKVADNPDDPNILTLSAIIKLLPLIINNKDNTLDTAITLEQLRDAFIEKVNNYSVTGAASFAYDQTMNYSFNFWLAFFVADLIECNDNTVKWKYIVQAIVLISAGAISLVQLSWQALQKWYNKKSYEEVTYSKEITNTISVDEDSDKESTHTAITQPVYKNKSLKHQLVEEFFLEQLSEKRKKEVLNNKMPKLPKNTLSDLTSEQRANDELYKSYIIKENIKNILDNKVPSEPTKKTKTSEQFDLLRDEVSFAREYNDPNTTTWQKVQLFGKRYFSIVQSVFKYCIGIGFIGWVVGAIFAAIGIAGHAAAAAIGAVILGNPVSIACAAGGALVGLALSYSKVGAEEKAEQELQQKFDANKGKIETLEKLESQNYQLKTLLKQNDIKPLTTLKAHNDRGFRRLTTEKPGLYTKFKEGMNRFAVAVGRGGSGILIIRLAVLPALAIGVGATLGGPVGLGLALGLGFIWMVANVYHFHQASKLEAAKRTLDDIDNRIKVAEDNQKIYLDQLGYSSTKNENARNDAVPPVEVPKAAEIPSQVPAFNRNRGEIKVYEDEAKIIKRLLAAYRSIKRKSRFFIEESSEVPKIFIGIQRENHADHLRRIIDEAQELGTCWGRKDDTLFEAMKKCGYLDKDGHLTNMSERFSRYWNKTLNVYPDQEPKIPISPRAN